MKNKYYYLRMNKQEIGSDDSIASRVKTRARESKPIKINNFENTIDNKKNSNNKRKKSSKEDKDKDKDDDKHDDNKDKDNNKDKIRNSKKRKHNDNNNDNEYNMSDDDNNDNLWLPFTQYIYPDTLDDIKTNY